MEMKDELGSTVERLAAAAGLLEQAVERLAQRQSDFAMDAEASIGRIVATVEARREAELEEKLAAAEAQIAELKAAAAFCACYGYKWAEDVACGDGEPAGEAGCDGGFDGGWRCGCCAGEPEHGAADRGEGAVDAGWFAGLAGRTSDGKCVLQRTARSAIEADAPSAPDEVFRRVWLRLRLFCFEREKDEREVYRDSCGSRLYLGLVRLKFRCIRPRLRTWCSAGGSLDADQAGSGDWPSFAVL